MYMTLIEASKNVSDPLASSVVQMYANASELLAAIPFATIQGNAYAYNVEAKMPGVAFRGLNEGFQPSVGVINPQSEALKYAGGEVDVDQALVRAYGPAVRTTYTLQKVRALANLIGYSVIKGDASADPREFDGLQKRLSLSGPQVIDAGSTSGGDALSLSKLDEAIDQTLNPTHLIVNKTVRRRLSAAARDGSIGGNLHTEKDDFGKLVTYYQGLPLLVVDETTDQDGEVVKILPFTEVSPGGGAAQSCSIYCISFGPQMLSGIQGAPLEVEDLGRLESKPAYRTRITWDVSIVLENARAATRLRGVRDAAVTV